MSYSSPQFVLESMEAVLHHNLRVMELEKEQKRSASLETFLAEDMVCLIKTKQHLKLTNEIIGPLFLEENDSLNLWRCFGRTIPQKSNNLKRRHAKSIPSEAPAAKIFLFSTSAPEFVPKSGSSSRTSSGFSIHASEFIPRSSSGSSTPTSSEHSSQPSSPNPLSGSFTFNVGVVNAPLDGSPTRRCSLDKGAFTIVQSKDAFVPRKIKVFSSEELQKQRQLVEEFKRIFRKSC